MNEKKNFLFVIFTAHWNLKLATAPLCYLPIMNISALKCSILRWIEILKLPISIVSPIQRSVRDEIIKTRMYNRKSSL